MKKILVTIAALMMLIPVFSDEKGDEIARKNDALKNSSDSYSEATMILIDKNGNKKVRKLTMVSKETKTGRNSFTEFLEPADVKGTKFLTLGKTKGDDEQRLYLPALKKTRLISASGKDGKFIGSDLTYYDLEDRDLSDSTYKYLKDEDYNGKSCFVLEVTPLDKNSPYSKSVVWVSKDDFFIYKIDCYDKKDNQLLKTIAMVEVKTIDGILIPSKTVVDNKKEGTKTLLQMDNIKLNTGIKDDIFTVQNLEK
jgi:outer membrane lipoprotein-sorting protein